jgi:hypothetical protein
MSTEIYYKNGLLYTGPSYHINTMKSLRALLKTSQLKLFLSVLTTVQRPHCEYIFSNISICCFIFLIALSLSSLLVAVSLSDDNSPSSGRLAAQTYELDLER